MFSIDLLDKAYIERFHKKEEMAARQKAAMRALSFYSAQRYLELIREKLPSSKEFKEYSDALGLFTDGLNDFGVRLNPVKGKVQDIEGGTSVIFIRPRANRKVNKQLLKLLVRFGPWTLRTLPYMPTKKEASVYVRKASPKDVAKVAKKNESERPKWERFASKLGKLKNHKITAVGTETTTDLEYFGWSIEFGLGAQKAIPHWRPALRKLATTELSRILEKKEIEKTMTDPKFFAWEVQDSKAVQQASVDELESYTKFMDRLKGVVKGV